MVQARDGTLSGMMALNGAASMGMKEEVVGVPPVAKHVRDPTLSL